MPLLGVLLGEALLEGLTPCQEREGDGEITESLQAAPITTLMALLGNQNWMGTVPELKRVWIGEGLGVGLGLGEGLETTPKKTNEKALE